MIDDVQHYNVSTDMGVPCLFDLACFFFSFLLSSLIKIFSHLSLKYLSPTIMCRLEAEIRDLKAALEAEQQRLCSR